MSNYAMTPLINFRLCNSQVYNIPQHLALLEKEYNMFICFDGQYSVNKIENSNEQWRQAEK